MKVIYILAYYSDGSGTPTLEFFPDYRAVDAAKCAAELATESRTVHVDQVPEFDEEKSDELRARHQHPHP